MKTVGPSRSTQHHVRCLTPGGGGARGQPRAHFPTFVQRAKISTECCHRPTGGQSAREAGRTSRGTKGWGTGRQGGGGGGSTCEDLVLGVPPVRGELHGVHVLLCLLVPRRGDLEARGLRGARARLGHGGRQWAHRGAEREPRGRAFVGRLQGGGGYRLPSPTKKSLWFALPSGRVPGMGTGLRLASELDPLPLPGVRCPWTWT